MNCLRCPETPLDERTREGVVIDTCPSCRGIWLDRGELEKLVARLSADDDDHDDDHDDDDDDDDDDDFAPRGSDGRMARARRRADGPERGGWMEQLGRFFD